MPARRFVRPTIESSYGTPKALPVLGTDCFYLRLSEAAGFRAELVPQVDTIPYGGGRTTAADEVCDVYLAQGALACILPPGIVSTILMNWALTLVNSGRTTPWVTTDASGLMPPGDLASLTLYHAWQNPDGSYTREKWLGCKSTQGSLSFVETPQGRKAMFESQFVGIKCATNGVEAPPPAAPDAVEFPPPAEADYPTGAWLFSHFARGTGTVRIGAARTQLANLKLSWENQIKARTYESQFNQIVRFLGRKVTAELELRHKPTPDDLASYQSRGLLDSEFILDNGTNTMKLDLLARNRISAHERQFPNDDEYGRKITLMNFWDPALANDVAVSFT